jgi:hypothetical protein
MGIYYLAANHTKHLYIDPFEIDINGGKLKAIAEGKFAKVLCYLMATSWQGDNVQVHPDSGSDISDEAGLLWYDKVLRDYINIGQDALIDYRDYLGN